VLNALELSPMRLGGGSSAAVRRLEPDALIDAGSGGSITALPYRSGISGVLRLS